MGIKDVRDKISACPMCGGNQLIDTRQQVLDILNVHKGHLGGSLDPAPISAKGHTRLRTERAHWPTGTASIPSASSASLTPDSCVEYPPSHRTPQLKGGSQSQLKALLQSRGSAPQGHVTLGDGRRTPTPLEDCGTAAGAEHLGDALHAIQASQEQLLQRGELDCPTPSSTQFRRSVPSSIVEGSVLLNVLPDRDLLTGHQGAILHMVQDVNGRLYTSSADKTIKVSCY
jgi:hypothetical protein